MFLLRREVHYGLHVDRQVPRKPRPVGGVKGHNDNEISFPGSPALGAGSFTNRLIIEGGEEIDGLQKTHAVGSRGADASSRTRKASLLLPKYRVTQGELGRIQKAYPGCEICLQGLRSIRRET